MTVHNIASRQSRIYRHFLVSSHVRLLALNGNNRLISSSICYLLENLQSPYLLCVSVAYCDLGIKAVPSIQAYLGFTRSRDVESLISAGTVWSTRNSGINRYDRKAQLQNPRSTHLER